MADPGFPPMLVAAAESSQFADGQEQQEEEEEMDMEEESRKENEAEETADDSRDSGGSSSQKLRRSNRQSSLRAQERIKGKEGSVERTDETLSGEALAEEKSDECPPKKRRVLSEGIHMNQSDPRFFVRLEDDGAVVAMSDESEVSSLNEDEVALVRDNYEKLCAKELTAEQRRERQRMVRQLEAELRQEEAQLMMLKKIRASQQSSAKDGSGTTGSRMLNGTSGGVGAPMKNGQGGPASGPLAYKPPVAQAPGQQSGRSGGRGHVHVPPQAHQQSVGGGKLGSSGAGATTLQQQQTQNGHAVGFPASSRGRSGTPTSSSLALPTHRMQQDVQTPAQKVAAARMKLRKQLEQSLLTIQPPAAPPAQIRFIPNPSQYDFVYLHGLDVVVGKVMKDKNKERRRSETPPIGPYTCSQCATDYTPTWKAEPGASEGEEGPLDLHCENCVWENQKRALKQEHTNRLKQAFLKALDNEKELEKEISDGKFDAPPPPATRPSPAASPRQTSAGAQQASVGANNRLQQQQPSQQHHHQHSSGLPQQQRRSSPVVRQQQQVAPMAHHHSSPSRHHHQQAQQQQQHHQQRHHHRSQQGQQAQQSQSNSTSSSQQQQQQRQQQQSQQQAAMNAVVQAMIQQQQQQGQNMNPLMAMAAMNMSNQNPMAAAGLLSAMSSPQRTSVQMLGGWNPALAQQYPQAALTMLAAQAAASAQQQQQQQQTSASSNMFSNLMGGLTAEQFRAFVMRQMMNTATQQQKQLKPPNKR